MTRLAVVRRVLLEHDALRQRLLRELDVLDPFSCAVGILRQRLAVHLDGLARHVRDCAVVESAALALGFLEFLGIGVVRRVVGAVLTRGRST